MKKSASAILILTIVLCLTLTAFAMTGPTGKITGMTQSLSLGYSGSGNLGEVYPQEEQVEYIYLYDSMFDWDDGYVPDATPTQLSASQIRSARLDARSRRSTGKVLDSITVNARESRIEVKFAKEYIGTKALDFDFDVILSVDGRHQSEYAMTFTGTLLNNTMEIYDGYENIDISDGAVANAEEYISKLEVDIGHGVTVTTKLSKGKSIYGTTTLTPASQDEEIMKAYPGITDVITLRTVGFSSAASTVKLGAEYADYYIYDKDLNYLGKGRDTLELTDKYYLSTKELDIELEESVAEATKPAPSEDVGTASTLEPANEVPANANYNPSTGR